MVSRTLGVAVSLFLIYANVPSLSRPIKRDVTADRAVDTKKIVSNGASMVEGKVDAILFVEYTTNNETNHTLSSKKSKK